MTYEQLIIWRYRLGYSLLQASIQLGLSVEEYEFYENGFAVIPKYLELAIFAIDLREYLFEKARKQNPRIGLHKGIGYAYVRSDFFNKLVNLRKITVDIKLDKNDDLFIKRKEYNS